MNVKYNITEDKLNDINYRGIINQKLFNIIVMMEFSYTMNE